MTFFKYTPFTQKPKTDILCLKKIIKKTVIITLAVFIITLVFGKINFITKAGREFLTPIFTFASAITHNVKNFLLNSDNNDKKDDFQQLWKAKKLHVLDVSAAEYNEKINRLELLLELKGELENLFSVTAAKVVSYTPGNMFMTVLINKGRLSGISVGDTVVCSQGIVGRITETGRGYSVVSTILNDNTSVSVRIVRNGMLGFVQGDSTLVYDRMCRVNFFSDYENVNVGDLLETTGGSTCPEGIPVGRIKECSDDINAHWFSVEPAVDIYKIYEVLIISDNYKE